MANREGHEGTDEWLEQINEDLRKKDVPHKRRPWDAWREWSKHVGVSTSLGDEDVKKIFDWFEKNTKAGSQYIGPMYVRSEEHTPELQSLAYLVCRLLLEK